MVTTTTIPEFQRYLQRMTPDALGTTVVPDPLRAGAPVPATWPYSPEAWEEFAEAAREHLRLKPKFDFSYAIAVQGFYPDELASGAAVVMDGSGRVFRREPEQDKDTIDRARKALHDMARAGVRIDSILQVVLEHTAAGGDAGGERKVKAAIDAAESAVRQYHAEREAEARKQAERPVLTVKFQFRAKRGKVYTPGVYRVSHEEAEELAAWREEMEEQAEQHGWEVPAGFVRESWPPFSIEDAS